MTTLTVKIPAELGRDIVAVARGERITKSELGMHGQRTRRAMVSSRRECLPVIRIAQVISGQEIGEDLSDEQHLWPIRAARNAPATVLGAVHGCRIPKADCSAAPRNVSRSIFGDSRIYQQA